jgi:hypothetical protein
VGFDVQGRCMFGWRPREVYASYLVREKVYVALDDRDRHGVCGPGEVYVGTHDQDSYMWDMMTDRDA